ncbi:hypothetical protein PtA15_8A415 [Puccinia triticina]|uniref:Uncharacterized protein n=1 Tax=Puccinia triticina TaxID=208348 RepID=A0ABY7CQH2_9BASI|nr:uncharacterized protein PtA15_8A415 [Puccinia triticina]WAQ87511.1 hypothetical protein PtA15_8A415 [Puccinia triticina]
MAQNLWCALGEVSAAAKTCQCRASVGAALGVGSTYRGGPATISPPPSLEQAPSCPLTVNGHPDHYPNMCAFLPNHTLFGGPVHTGLEICGPLKLVAIRVQGKESPFAGQT